MILTRVFVATILAVAYGQLGPLPGPKVAHKKGVTNKAVEDRIDQYWQRAQQEVYRSVEELQAQKKREIRRGNPPVVFIRGDARRKLLALTFDDGPHPNYTPQLLEVLKKENIKATFFVIGFMAERYPDLVKAESDAGHQVANHTFSHVTLTHLPADEIRTEFRACDDVIQKITGKRPLYCRPPGGDYDSQVVTGAKDEALVTVLWTDDPGDYAAPGTGLIERVTLRKLSNGGIVLLHDGADQTLKVLPQIIDHARKEGFRFVTIDELYRGK